MGQEEEELVIEWYMYDLHFKRLSPPEASAAVSEVLAVAPAEIRIVADWDELTEGDTPTVRCLLSDGGYGRGYRIGLSVWCKRCTLSKPDFARRMARRLESPCLIADNSVDSFTWLRVTPDGQIRPMERDERIRARYLPPDIQDPEES
jgi:hypothetical protein